MDSLALRLDPNPYGLDDEKGEWKEDKRSQGQRRHSVPPRITVYPTPTTPSEMLALIKVAQVEADPRVLAIYDGALAAYLSDRRLIERDPGPIDQQSTDAVFQILRLDLPQSKRAFIGQYNHIRRTIRRGHDFFNTIEDDSQDPLSDVVHDRLTVTRLNQIKRNACERLERPSESSVVLDEARKFAEELTRQNLGSLFRTEQQVSEPEGDPLVKMDINNLFLYFLFLLEVPEAGESGIIAPPSSDEDPCSILFQCLMRPEFFHQLDPWQLSQVAWLALRHPKLAPFLGVGEDEVRIQCSSSTSAPCEPLLVSRFLLSAESDYFRLLLKEERALDLRQGSLDRETLDLLLRWISHPYTEGFAFPASTNCQDLEKLITMGASVQLVREPLFREMIQVELRKRLTPETFPLIFGIAIRYHLPLLTAFCLSFVNGYPEGNLFMSQDEHGSFEIEQGAVGGDLPPSIYEGLGLLGNRWTRAKVVNCRPKTAPSNGCLSRFVRTMTGAGSFLWNTCGGLAKRAAVIALSIFTVEKMAGDPWQNARDYPLAVGLALIYPLVERVVQRCFRQRPPSSLSLIHLAPTRIQVGGVRAAMGVQEAVYGCARRCLWRCGGRQPEAVPLVGNRNPLLAALPAALQTLDLSRADDLSDNDLDWLSVRCAGLTSLKLGYHPDITRASFALLARFNGSLTDIGFHLERGEGLRTLGQLRLDQVFQREEGAAPIRIEVSLFDTNALYFPTPLFQQIPAGSSLKVHLKHVHIPNWSILFETHPGSGSSRAWPGIGDSIAAQFSQATDFETTSAFTRDDLRTVVDHMTHCRRLWLHSSAMQDAELAHIGLACPGLEDLRLGGADLTNEGLRDFLDLRANLRRVSIHSSPRLTDASLQRLAGLEHLSKCHLDNLRQITDRGARLLLGRRHPIEDLIIENCPGISDEMTCRLFRRSRMRLEQEAHRFIRQKLPFQHLPFPHQIATRLLPEVLFENLLQAISLSSFRRRGRFEALTPEDRSRFPHSLGLSSLEAFALVHMETLYPILRREVLLGMEKEKLQYRSESAQYRWMQLVSLFFLQESMQPYREKLGQLYRLYLTQRYPPTYVLEVDRIVNWFENRLAEIMRARGGEASLLLPQLLPLLFFNRRRGEELTRRLFLNDEPIFSRNLLSELDGHIGGIEGTEDWSKEQRLAAKMAPFFMLLDWMARLLSPPPQDDLVVAPIAEREEDDRKEGKKEEKQGIFP